MENQDTAARSVAVDQAKGSSALSGFVPTEFGLSVYEQWIAGRWNVDEAVELLIQHHKELEAKADSTDQLASLNLLGITDSVRMKQAEADITILRMAEMCAERLR